MSRLTESLRVQIAREVIVNTAIGFVVGAGFVSAFNYLAPPSVPSTCSPEVARAVVARNRQQSDIDELLRVGCKRFEIRTPHTAYLPLAEKYASVMLGSLNDPEVNYTISAQSHPTVTGQTDNYTKRVIIVYDPTDTGRKSTGINR